MGWLEISEWTTCENEVRTSYDIWAEDVINVSTREDGGNSAARARREAQQMGDVLTGGALAVPIEGKLVQWAAVRNPLGAISVPEQSTSYSPGYTYSATRAPIPACRLSSGLPLTIAPDGPAQPPWPAGTALKHSRCHAAYPLSQACATKTLYPGWTKEEEQ